MLHLESLFFFAWELGCGSTLTIDKLIKIGKILMTGCYLCYREKETCDHILLRYSIVLELWNMVYGILGVSWVRADNVRDKIWA